jgi:hypothetical protein
MGQSNAIGTGAVILTANADGVEPGLNKATSSLQKWAKDSDKIAAKVNSSAAKSVGSNMGSSIVAVGGGGLAAAGATIGTLIGGPAGTALGGAIGSGVGAAVSAGAGFFEDATKSVKELAAQGKVAASLGVSSDQFMGLGLAAKKAGVDQEQFAAVLGKMEGKVAQAAAKGGAYAESLSSIGLSAKQVAGMSADQQLLAISTAISTLPDAGQKAAAAIELFGEQGTKLLPMLTQGGAKLQEFADKQKSMGTAIGDGDMEAVSKAAAAIPKVQAQFDGLWNRIVVGVAPVIEAVGGALTQAFDAVRPIIQWVGDAGQMYFQVWGAVLQVVVSEVIEVATSIAKWAGEFTGLSGSMTSGGDLVFMVMKKIGVGAAYVWDALKAGTGVMAQVAGKIVEGFGKVLDVIESAINLAKDLPEAIRPKFVDSWGKGIADLKKESAKVAEDLAKWGQEKVGELGTSAPKVEGWFDKMKAKLDAKPAPKVRDPIATPEDEVKAGADSDRSKLGGAFSKGSHEAYQVESRFKAEGMFKDDKAVAKEQLTWLARIGQAAERQRELLQELIEASKDEEEWF